MNDDAPPTDDPLRLTCCPDCGYSLRGLPDAGACPECGRAYDTQRVVLLGYARGSLAHAGNARLSIALLIVLAPLANLALMWWTQPNVGSLVFWGVYLLWLCWLLSKRWRTDVPGLVQVHLSADGCRQIDVARAQAATKPPTPWRQIRHVTLDALWVAKPVVRIKLSEVARWWQFERTPVNAEIDGGPEVLAVLRERITRWRDA